MPSSYTPSLRLVLPVTGELLGTWGDTVNQGLTELVDAAIAGTAAVTMTDANYTLSLANESADESRNMCIRLSGALTAQRQVICPPLSKLYVVSNETTGSQSIVFKTAAGTGITVPNGSRRILYCNGTSVQEAITDIVFTSGDQTVAGQKIFSAGVNIGNANAGAFYDGAESAVNIRAGTSPSFRNNLFLDAGPFRPAGSVQERRIAMPANDVDLALANYFTKTIAANTVFTVSNVPLTGTAASFILDLTNAGAFSITWWAGVQWPNGAAPLLTLAGRDVLAFFTYDSGTTWTGVVLARNVG
jgi:hypothetical protein